MRALLAAALTVAALLAAPAASAGTREDPEIRDAVGDARYDDQLEPSADVIRGWFREAGGNLTVRLDLLDFNGSARTRARLINTSYQVAFDAIDSFDGQATPWRLQAGWTPTGMDARLERNGSRVRGASLRAEATPDGPVLRWRDYETYLSAGAVLNRTKARTVADDADHTRCLGGPAVDCAPNGTVGDDVQLAGTRPDATVGEVTVSADRRRKEVRAGNATFFEVGLANAGNASIDVTLTVDAGPWNASAAPSTVAVPAGGTNRSRVTVAVPADAEPGRYNLSIAARTPDGSAVLDLGLDVEPRLERNRSVTVRAAEPTLNVLPGAFRRTAVVVENVGDTRSRYDLGLAGNASAWTTLSQERVVLEAGNATRALLGLDVPDDAQPGRYALHVAARSVRGDASDAAQIAIRVAAPSTPVGVLAAVVALAAGAALPRRDEGGSGSSRMT